MPKAKKQNITKSPVRRPQATPVLDPATFPEEYALEVVGDSMLPEIKSGAYAVFRKSEPVHAGDVVCIWMKPGCQTFDGHRAGIKRLVTNIPPWVNAFPYTDHPKSDVHGRCRIRKQLEQYTVECSMISAIHKFDRCE